MKTMKAFVPHFQLGMLLLLFSLSACTTTRQGPNTVDMRAIDLFKTYLTGDFNNERQITQEKAAGQQLHPHAVHINRVADNKLIGAPEVDGFWLLEESYYTYPGKATDIKPYLFLFEALGDTAVLLTPYKFPESLPVADIRNDNAELYFSYNDIKPSPSFKPAAYQLRAGKFYLNAVNELGNGMQFSLIETISKDQLIVMELLEKNGQRLTPYDTPIVYDRVKE
jgi:hypothetical protein